MQLVDLLSKCYAAEFDEAWERERTANTLTGVAVRLHAIRCSLRETRAILRLIDVERSHQAIWYWVHRLANSVPDPPTAQSSRIAIEEIIGKINGNWSWVYTAIALRKHIVGGESSGDFAVILNRLWYAEKAIIGRDDASVGPERDGLSLPTISFTRAYCNRH